jgi:hypothetical protein
LKQYLALKRGGHLPTAEDSVVMFNMDYRFMRRLAPRTYAEVDKRAAERDESSTRADGGK